MALTDAIPAVGAQKHGRDVGFAIGIVAILCVLFLPIPAFMIDMGLALSIAFSVLIENGLYGGTAAAPAASQIVEAAVKLGMVQP